MVNWNTKKHMHDTPLRDTFLGNYRLIRALGQGMSSQVYLAEHRIYQTRVAIKVLNGYQEQTEIERFLARASVLTHLSHPRIVSVLDYGVEGSTAFLVMPYLPYGTLRQLYPRGTRLEPETLLPYVEQIAEGLHYVHQHNLIHRDVKPHNLLLNEEDEVLLSDFGIAVVSQSHQPITFHDFEGTAPYAAPEQLQGKPRRSSDQYALAVVVYEWLAGDWPFSGSFDEIVRQHLFESPPTFLEKGVVVSPMVAHVIMRGLAKEPEQRFPSILAFANALKAAIQPQGVSLTPPIPQLPLTPPPPPRKGLFKSPLPFSEDV